MRKTLLWNAQWLMLQFYFFVPAFLPFCWLLIAVENGPAKIYSGDRRCGRNNKHKACLPSNGRIKRSLERKASGIFMIHLTIPSIHITKRWTIRQSVKTEYEITRKGRGLILSFVWEECRKLQLSAVKRAFLRSFSQRINEEIQKCVTPTLQTT